MFRQAGGSLTVVFYDCTLPSPSSSAPPALPLPLSPSLTRPVVFHQAGITAIRRVRKSDNNRIGRACGATVVNRTDELREDDIGTGAGLFEIKKVSARRGWRMEEGGRERVV